MTDTAPAATLPTPTDNLFGICARVGADFGFNPLWLRLAFACTLILNPVAVIGAYFGLGAVVLLSRFVFPQRAAIAQAPAGLPTPIRAHAAEESHLPLAA